jgi:tRNA(Ile)-lysidine synthase TilS/MesJ
MEPIILTQEDNAHYFNPIRKAILNHGMIEPGDKVAVGMSGGKDSTSMLYFLDRLKKQNRLGFDFEIVPITLDPGVGMDFSPMVEFARSLGYEPTIVPTEIFKIVFEIRAERSPCSLCANLRRGMLYSTAKEMGCNKVALGHHVDDAIETFFMNFFLHGKMASFEPITYLSRNDISIIRPYLYLEEKDIISFVNKHEVPVIFNPCPMDKKTKREDMKHFVENLNKQFPGVKRKFIRAMEDGVYDNFWNKTYKEGPKLKHKL